MLFRRLKANEIEARVGMCREDGLTLLLYKDARVDQSILDEEVGSMNWQKHYTLIDGQLFCTVSIWDAEKGQWIEKMDVGVESNTEAEKGRASDAQKRACVVWGIGRELYSSPFIWISADQCNIKLNKNGKYECRDSFEVANIDYAENGDVCALTIVNRKTKKEVYKMGNTQKPASEADTKLISDLCKLLEYDKGILLQECGWRTGEVFTTEIAVRCKAKLNEISEQRRKENGK